MVVLIASMALTAWSVYLSLGIGIKSKMKDLLPETAPSVVALQEVNERLGSADNLIVALVSDQFKTLIPHLEAIAATLEAHPDIRKVEWRQDVELIDRNALIIFPTLPELKDHYQSLRERIRDEVKKRTRLLDEDESDAEGDEPAFKRYTYSWAEHEQDDGLSNLGRTFRSGRGKYREYFYNMLHTAVGLKVHPVRSSGDLKFSRHILDVANDLLNQELEQRFGGVGEGRVVSQVVLAGGYRNTVERANQVKSDMLGSIGIAFGILSLIIMVFFRSVRALFCVLIPVASGIAWTGGFVALTIGYVNLITAFIFAILLGLGIDFGIHFFARYKEEYSLGRTPVDAMVTTHQHCGSASILAAVTTSSAFAALSIADFRGFSQFGGVAAAGVLLSLIAVIVIFTALVFSIERVSPMGRPAVTQTAEQARDKNRKPFPLSGRFVLFALGVGAFCLASAGQVGFELNMNKLMQKDKVKPEYQRVTYGTVKSSAPAVLIAANSQEARSLHEQLTAIGKTPEGKQFLKEHQSLFALIPTEQKDKITWVGKICRKLKRKVKLFEGDSREGADEILKRCEPTEFSVGDLPDWVKAKFTDKTGKVGEFIFVTPRGSINDGERALAFRDLMLSLETQAGTPPAVTGKPIVWADIITAMYVDGKKTTIAAFITVFLLLLLFERSLIALSLIVLPLVLGIAYTLGLMVLLGIKINFFNMLVLPTIIGIGVDDGVHIYHRYRELGPNSARYVVRSTGMAAVLTSLTTSVGFGSLLTANLFGLNSLGLLSIIAIFAALFTTLFVMPAAMQWLDNRQPTNPSEVASA
ncbi:MAG: MMPL family transporter [Myxococcota bacterium]|nr:MMPL family transporter [Myxococcota bacterium]